MSSTKQGRLYVLGMAFIASLVGLMFGWFMSIISGAEKPIQSEFALDGFWHGLTVSIAMFGTVLGAITVGKPADALGRKKVLVLLTVIFFIGSVGGAVAPNWHVLVASRFFGGLAVGASSVMGPMYIAEIAPAHIRGRMVMLFQFNIVLGSLLAFVSNYLVANWVGPEAWRVMLGIVAAPAFVSFLLMLAIPQTPRWLVLKQRHQEARDVLLRLGYPEPEGLINEIHDSLKQTSPRKKESIFARKYRIPVLLVLLIAVFNQLSGIPVVMNYSPRIFELAGFAAESALLQAIAVGVTNLVFTILAMFLIDRFGRKKLLIGGSVGMIVFLGLISMTLLSPTLGNYLLVVYFIGFIAFFASSQGAVVWVFVSEIVPNRVRAKGQSIGSFGLSLTSALLTWVFPYITQSVAHGGSIIFGTFAVLMAVQLVVFVLFFPETKGRSLEQIQQDLGID